MKSNIIYLPELREQTHVFQDRTHAGQVLAKMLAADDGLASGFTMRVAVAALRNAGAGRIVVAVPTAHRHSAEMIARDVEALYCANIRGSLSYAVASAYQHWSDVAEEDMVKILEQFKTRDL